MEVIRNEKLGYKCVVNVNYKKLNIKLLQVFLYTNM